MPEPTVNQGQSKVPFAIGVAIVAGAVGFLVGWQGGAAKASKESYAKGAADAKTEATQRLQDAGLIRPSVEDETSGPILSVSGTVTSTGADSFVLLVRDVPSSPLEDATERSVTVRVDGQTKIVLSRRMTPEERGVAQEAFRAAREKAELGGNEEEMAIVPPSGFVEINGTLADVKAGVSVSVETTDDATGKTAVTAASLSIRIEERGEEPAEEAGGEPVPAEQPAP